VPNLFAIERPAVGKVLVRHPPASFHSLDDVNDARSIAGVGVVVDREEIAKFVEREFLRIAKSGCEELQLAAVAIAAQHGSGVGIREQAVGRLDMQAAVADGEVNFSVRPFA
jgi:hypothetical protein